jgi:hypothetical protein
MRSQLEEKNNYKINMNLPRRLAIKMKLLTSVLCSAI